MPRFHIILAAAALLFGPIIGWGAAPTADPVGGALQSLGMVTGAHLDATTGRLVLIGDGANLEYSPTPAQVAVAFKWAFANTPEKPFVSIDPIPEAPSGPFMKVAVDEGSQDTEFGWVMLEADRRLKVLSLGTDNISLLPAKSGVVNYKDMFDLHAMHRTAKSGNELWVRYWFHPKENSVQWDGSSMRILKCKMGVRTENMVMKAGKLESTGGQTNPASEAFATHFTEHYAEFGREDGVFMQLEQQCRLLLVSEWLRYLARTNHLPVNLAWAFREGGPHFRMPRFTPTLRVTRTKKSQTETAVLTETLQYFGGVDLGVRPQVIPVDKAFDGWKKGIAGGLTDPSVDHAKWTHDGRPQAGSRLPGERGATPNVEPALTAGLALPKGGSLPILTVPSRRGLQPLSDASAGEIALPQLTSYLPEGREGKTETMGSSLHPDKKVEVRHYELTAPDGTRLGWFTQHALQQGTGKLVVADSLGKNGWALSVDPLQPTVAWALQNGSPRWAFDISSGLPVAEYRGQDFVRYRYNKRGVLDKIETDDGQPLVTFSQSRNGSCLSGARMADGQSQDFRSADVRSEMRDLPPLITVTVHNEVEQPSKVSYDREQGLWKLPDGTDPGRRYMESLPALEEVIFKHLRRIKGSIKDITMVENGGCTLIAQGENLHLVPQSLQRLRREMERLQGTEDKLPPDSLLAMSLSSNKKTSEPFVLFNSGDQLMNRLGALHGAKSPESSQMLLCSTDPERAHRAVDGIIADRRAQWKEGRDWLLRIFTETLDLQPVTRQMLDRHVKRARPENAPDANASLIVFVYHEIASIRKAIEANANSFRGKFLVCLGCQSNPKTGERQAFAESLREAGASAVFIADSYLHADAVARVLDELHAMGDAAPGNNPASDSFQHFHNAVKSALQKAQNDPNCPNEVKQTLQGLLLSPTTAQIRSARNCSPRLG